MLYDYKNKKVPYIPMHTIGADVAYRLDFSGSKLESLTFGANISAQGKIYWDEANSASQPFYALLGLHAGIQNRSIPSLAHALKEK